MYRKVLSFLMVLVVLSVLIFFFSCSLSPRLTKVPTNEGSIADTTPPSVTITFPTNGQVLYDNNITVTGTASDEGSVYAVDNSNNVSVTNSVSFIVRLFDN